MSELPPKQTEGEGGIPSADQQSLAAAESSLMRHWRPSAECVQEGRVAGEKRRLQQQISAIVEAWSSDIHA